MRNQYKEILDNIEYSFSSLHLYEQCPYAFYLKKICNTEGIGNAYAEIGSYGHELNEAIFKNEMTVDQALQDCIENFDNRVCCPISDSSKEKKFLALCDYLANFDDTYLDKFDVIGVEKEFRWEIEKYKCVGYADLILKDKETGKVYLIDHKSAGHFLKKDGTVLKNQQQNFEAYSKQMYMYADAMIKEYGFAPDYIVWSHFLDANKTVILFNENDYKDAIKWVISTIKAIYEDKIFEAKEDYTLCNMLCDYRSGECEYKELRKEEDG